jgi:Protein of unknown function (DUF1761)
MATQVPVVQSRRVKHNFVAILVAAIVNFLLEAAWYSGFYTTWLKGIDRTDEWLKLNSPNRALQFATALVASAVIAGVLSFIVQYSGPQTLLRGIKSGLLMWLGFVLTTWATEYVFEVRPFSLLLVNAGFWLVGMVLMGGIVGAWRAKGAGGC